MVGGPDPVGGLVDEAAVGGLTGAQLGGGGLQRGDAGAQARDLGGEAVALGGERAQAHAGHGGDQDEQRGGDEREHHLARWSARRGLRVRAYAAGWSARRSTRWCAAYANG